MIRADKFTTGDVLDDYADFRVVECINCKCQYIHDFEHYVLFYNPQNLEQHFLTLFEEGEKEQYPLPCRECNKSDWDFKDINSKEKTNVLNGKWGWAIG